MTTLTPEQKTAKAASEKKISAVIKGLAKSGKTLQANFQEAAIEVIKHVDLYGEASLANALVDALPNMARKTALLKFFETYGKMKYNVDKKALAYKKDFKTDLEGAAEKMWWEMVKEPEYRPFDLDKEIAKLLKRAANRADEGDERDVIPADKLEALKALAPAKAA